MTKYDFNRKIEEQSQRLADSHEMLVEALEGQVYIKEAFHKVDTNQVTGEAVKKVSVGGKGGFGSQGDARDQEKQVDVTSRVMVLSPPSQEAFDHNVSLTEAVVGFEQKFPYKPIFIKEGEEHTIKRFVPSHLFGDREIKGWIEDIRKLGRDYNEYAHSNQLTPADAQALAEFHLSGEALEIARERYDELCGYKGAWQYVRGENKRDYRIVIVNLLNEKIAVKWKMDKMNGEVVYWKESNPEVKGSPSWTDEHSTSRHHQMLWHAMNEYYYRYNEDDAVLKEWLERSNNDHAFYVMWSLGQRKSEFWSPIRNQGDVKTYPAGKWTEARRVKMSDEYEAKREAIKELTDGLYFDLKAVYRYEGTTKGKVKYLEADKLPRPADWKCEDRSRRNKNRDYYKNLRNEKI